MQEFSTARLMSSMRCSFYARMMVIYFVLISPLQAFTEAELRWLNSDNESITSHVNEGRLNFNIEYAENILSTTNHLYITQQSIDQGWVKVRQCYQHLDSLEEVEISFRYRYIKNLKVLSSKNIARFQQNKQSITLYNISDNAKICVELESRIFYQNPNLSFSLVNGPFHRKFLDGYYPYHVHLFIHYPGDKLVLKKTIPQAQTGFKVTQKTNLLEVDSLFEGKLNIEIIFDLNKTHNSQN